MFTQKVVKIRDFFAPKSLFARTKQLCMKQRYRTSTLLALFVLNEAHNVFREVVVLCSSVSEDVDEGVRQRRFESSHDARHRHLGAVSSTLDVHVVQVPLEFVWIGGN